MTHRGPFQPLPFSDSVNEMSTIHFCTAIVENSGEMLIFREIQLKPLFLKRLPASPCQAGWHLVTWADGHTE